MTIRILLISLLLPWVSFDQNLFRRRRSSAAAIAFELFDAEEEFLQQRKKFERHRWDVIPSRFRNIKKPDRSRCNYFSTKPRDVRFSNQRKIRRMFNGC